MNAQVAARAKDFPDLEIAYADAQQDNAKQVADVENFLRQKIDLLIISPNEAKPLTPIVRRVFEQKIPVIVLDRAIEGDTYTTFIGADNKLIGKAAGEYIAKVLNGKGDVVEIQGLPARRPRATAATASARRSRSSPTSTSSTTPSRTGCARRRCRRWSPPSPRIRTSTSSTRTTTRWRPARSWRRRRRAARTR
jgi:ribose transport system substrate-binding protein